MTGLLFALAATMAIQAGDPPPAANPLAGPKVQAEASSEPKSLVRRGFNGTVEPLTIEADTAAIELLELTDEQQVEYDRIKAERSDLFSKAIRENLDLLMEFGGVDAKERPAEFLSLLNRVGEALRDYRSRGTMMHEMMPYLTNDQMREVRGLVAEYVQARTAAIRQETGPDTPTAVIAIRMHVETLGAMAKASIESAIAMGSAVFEDLSQRLGLTPEQQSKIQKIFEPIAIQELQGKKVNPIAKVRVFFQISHLLTKEQMAKLAQYNREEQEAAKAATALQPSSNPSSMKMDQDH